MTPSAVVTPTLTVDETVLATNATASFAGLFTTNYGADGAGSTAYTLGVVAGPSGLVDTATGQAVNLSLNGGGIVEGRTAVSNALVFTGAVDGSGNVTLDQIRAVVHSPNTGPDQSTSLSAANLITLTATSTDGDGDTASATANIANALVFKDDAPAIDIAASSPGLVVDESLGTSGSVQNEGGRVNNDETLIGAAPSAIGFAQGSLVNLVSANAGADGEASRAYALNVNNAGSGLQDSVTNNAIVLVAVNATTVEGRVGSSAGAVSFRIAIDPATGAATINQFRAVEHNDSTNHDENSGSEALMNAGALSLGITLTDRDGDQATDNVDISQLFKFEDDGPAATGESGTTNEILKDFNTAFVIDFSGSIDNSELNTQLGAVKAAINQLFGSTGGSVSVKFVLFAANAMASATFTSAAAANTYLDSVNPATGGARPSGALGNTTDFSAAITTLLANYAADETADNQVFFLSDGNPNENLGSSGQALNNTIRPLWNSFVNNNDINVTAIGVGDGINNSNLQQIDVDGAGAPILVANFDDLIATLVSLFTPTPITGNLDVNDDFGTDGGRILAITVPTAAAVDPVYTWNGLSGAASQITVSGGGATITGFTSILVGTELGGQFVVDFATGQWSYTPPRNVPADRTETFSYTIVDGDGDTASAALNVLVENNDPPATAAVTATVDDDALTGGIAGGTGDLDANAGEVPASASEAIYNGTLNITATDNPVAAISFAQLQGATAVIGQETVTYSWNAVTNLLTANISVSPAGRTGTTLFTVQLNNPSSGSYTVTLVDNVLHSNVAGENDVSVALTYRVADTDGSTNTGTLNVIFDDDAPTLGVIQNGTANNLPASATTTGALNFIDGADDTGPVGTISLTTTGITSGGKNIVTVQVGNVLTGYADVDLSGTKNVGDTAVFTLTVNPTTGSSGQYVFDLIAPLDGVIVNTPIGGSSSFGAGPTGSQILSDTAGGSNLAVVSGWLAGGSFNATNWYNGTNALPAGLTLSSVNGSTGGWGVANNNFAAGEFMRFDFGAPMDDFDGAGPYVPPAVSLPPVSYATFDLIGYGGTDTIQFRVHYTDGSSANQTATGTQVGYLITAPAGKFIDWIDLYTANAVGSGKIDLTAVGVQNTLVDRTLGFNVTLTDGDGDAVTGSFSVKVKDGNTPSSSSAPVVLDLNGDGVEFVSHSAGVTFDYAGDGSPESTAWISGDDGLLALDRNGDGIVNDGSEIVFARDGLTDLQGLAADYDSNHDGMLDASDADFAKFGVWQDANSNGVTDAGEFRSLSDAGIVSINLISDGIAYSAANGSVSVAGQSVYTKADGSTGILADAAFATGGTSTATTRTSEEIRSGNVTASVIAAALVGLAVENNAVAAPDGHITKTVVDESGHSVAANDVGLIAVVNTASMVTSMASDPAHEFVQHTGDVASSSRPADDGEAVHSFQDAPVSQQSDLLADSNDAVSSDTGGSAFNFGGDQVMHSMLDMAAFAPSVDGAGNSAIPLPVADAVHEAMPDMMVDRLIDAFSGDVKAPASDTAGAVDNHDALAGMLTQGIDAFQISGMASNDVSGSHQYDMATITHA